VAKRHIYAQFHKRFNFRPPAAGAQGKRDDAVQGSGMMMTCWTLASEIALFSKIGDATVTAGLTSAVPEISIHESQGRSR
jgi:hypothetical protein